MYRPRGSLPGETLAAAARGWRLLPVRERCKIPLVREWPKAATSAPARLEAWAAQFPRCNWALATGPASGVFVLDVDGEQGEDALLAHHRQGQSQPGTLTVSTGRGKHLYFRWPEGLTIRNSAGKLGRGLDIRGEGGFVVIPPSVHPSGTEYAYFDPDVPVSDAPAWLLALVAQPSHTGISVLCEGHRNDGLIRLAGAWRRRGASQGELERRLRAENARRCRPALPDSEVIDIAASAARYPVGGPDPLESAWQRVLEETHGVTYQKLLALARHLQIARPGLPIALPLVRISKHMECDWTLVRRYRQRAKSEGLIVEVRGYVKNRMAAQFIVPDPDKTGVPLTVTDCTTSSPTSI
jgi:hypothetical protein